MAQEDLANNRNVRKVMVRHWIDLGRISVSSACGTVSIRGTLQLLRGVNHELDSTLVDTIFHTIKRIDGVKRMHIDLDNWACIEGAWQPISRNKQKDISFDDGKETSYEI